MNESELSKVVEKLIKTFEAGCAGPVTYHQRPALERQLTQLVREAVLPENSTEYRQVTILMSDLRGFTSVSEKLTPFDTVKLLNRYFRKMSEIIFDYQGTIDKFMGDAIMVLFGAPTSGNDDLQRAIGCAVEMQLAMNDINKISSEVGFPPLYMGIGINTGVVVAGTVGSDLYREYTVIGSQVNLVSRIEAHSLRGQILLSENSYRLAKDYIEVSGEKEVMVKGKTEPVTLYELKSTTYPALMQVPEREVRSSHRVKVDMPLVFQMMRGKTVLPEIFYGRILDISYNGLLAALPFAPDPHSEIKLNMSTSLLGCDSTQVYARILRVVPHGSEYECSIEITSIDDVGEKAIHQFVDSQIV